MYVSEQARMSIHENSFGTQKKVAAKIFLAKTAIFNKLAFSERSLNLYQDVTSFMDRK